jgi:hypothetical protein
MRRRSLRASLGLRRLEFAGGGVSMVVDEDSCLPATGITINFSARARSSQETLLKRSARSVDETI